MYQQLDRKGGLLSNSPSLTVGLLTQTKRRAAARLLKSDDRKTYGRLRVPGFVVVFSGTTFSVFFNSASVAFASAL